MAKAAFANPIRFIQRQPAGGAGTRLDKGVSCRTEDMRQNKGDERQQDAEQPAFPSVWRIKNGKSIGASARVPGRSTKNCRRPMRSVARLASSSNGGKTIPPRP